MPGSSADARRWSSWLWLPLTAAVLWGLTQLASVVTPLLVALTLAFVLDPAVTRLAVRLGNRTRATLLVLGSALLVIGIAVAVAIPMLTSEARHWVAAARGEGPAGLSRGHDQVVDYGAWTDPDTEVWQAGTLAAALQRRDAPAAVVQVVQAAKPSASEEGMSLCDAVGDYDCDGKIDPGYARRWKALKRDRNSWAAALAQTLDRSGLTRMAEHWSRTSTLNKEVGKWLQGDGLADAGSWGKRVLGSLGTLLSTLLGWAMAAVLIPFYAFAFLHHLPRWRETVPRYLPHHSRAQWVHIGRRIGHAISGFVRGRLVVCAVVGLLTGIGWLVMGVRLGLLMGLLVGALTVVPFVNIVALVPVLLMSLLEVATGAHGWGWLAGVIAVYGAGQVADSVLNPVIVGDAVQLDMVSIVVALLIGGAVAGALGLVVAIPVAASLRILAEEWLLPRWRMWADGPPGGEPPTDTAGAGG